MTRRKFKVGDRVVSKVDRCSCKKGWVGTVTFYSNREYSVKMPNGFTYYFTGIELDAYVEPVKKPAKTKKVEKKEHKFKVGDIVRGTSERYLFTNSRMTKGRVEKCGETKFDVRIIEHKDGICGGVYPVRYEDFEKIEEPKNTIVIYQRDRDVVAFDKTTGQKCYAHCHPDDAFDFKTGAKIAFDRLVGRVEPVKEEATFFNGKVVCVANPYNIHELEVGKIYTFVNGDCKLNGWLYVTGSPVTSVDDLNSRFSTIKFIEVVE